MSKVYEILLTLLRSALWNREIDRPDLFPIDDAMWEQVLNESMRQTVSGLVFSGVCMLPDSMLPSSGLIARWASISAHIENKNAILLADLIDINETLLSAGIRAILIKGHAAAVHYPKPELRESGDIDLWIPDANDMEKALKVLGVNPEKAYAPDDSYAFLYANRSIVELHTTMVSLMPKSHLERLCRLMQTYPHTELQLQSGKRPVATLSPIVDMIMLNHHILRHASSFGMGLRQICDLAMVYNDAMTAERRRELADFFIKGQARRWAAMVDTFMTHFLGLPQTKALGIGEQSARPLMRIVVQGGNFGKVSAKSTPTVAYPHRLLHVLRNNLALWPYAPENVTNISVSLLKRYLR